MPRTIVSAINAAHYAINEVSDAADYRMSWTLRNEILNEHQRSLSILLSTHDDLTDDQIGNMKLCMARAWIMLGEYQNAEGTFSSLYSDVLVGLNDVVASAWSGHKIWSLQYLIDHLVSTGRDLDFAEAVLRALPWLRCKQLDTKSFRWWNLIRMIQLLIVRGNHSESRKYLSVAHTLFPEKRDHDYIFMLLMANTEAAGGARSRAQQVFIEAYVISALGLGQWAEHTLLVLEDFGRALWRWECHQEAVVILNECYHGRNYRLGATHPLTARAQEALLACNIPRSKVKDLARLRQVTDGLWKSTTCVAYENICLDTPIDLLQRAGITNIDYVRLLTMLEGSYVKDVSSYYSYYKSSVSFDFDVSRTIARCTFSRGDIKNACENFKELARDKSLSTESRIKLLRDLALAADSKRDVLYSSPSSTDLESVISTSDALKYPWMPDRDLEILGRGAYSLVQSLQIGEQCYARKSILLPRRNQRSIRNVIQNEISVLRTFSHPHIIEVFLTYEDKSCFYIVLQPLADCDLEVYLDEHSRKPPTHNQKDMVWRWFSCLANTLAFIHSEGVRHKDIKPRNILVKNEHIIFTDFGSSYLVADEDHSTTDGPAFGHTRLYCAPEVAASARRGRSSDIFSLGCIFMELTAWLIGQPIADWNNARETIADGVEIAAYYLTRDRAMKLFYEHHYNDEIQVLLKLIHQMTLKDPQQRPTAVATSKALPVCYQKGHQKDLQPCGHCGLETIGVESDGEPDLEFLYERDRETS